MTTLDDRLLEETREMLAEGIVANPESRAWECPCGQEPPKPGRATPVRTLVSLMEPRCPFCEPAFREEYRRA